LLIQNNAKKNTEINYTHLTIARFGAQKLAPHKFRMVKIGAELPKLSQK